MMHGASLEILATVVALTIWAPTPAPAAPEQTPDSTTQVTPALWETAPKKPAADAPSPPKGASSDAAAPAPKATPAAMATPATATKAQDGEVRRPIKQSDLGKDRQHPQVQRARILLNNWMARRYGMDWRLRGTRPPQELKVLAAHQASEEYQQYYALAAALRSRFKEAALSLPAMGSRAASRPKVACKHVRWLGERLKRTTPRMQKQQADAELTGALLAPKSVSRAQSGRCVTEARGLLATAHMLQKAFGALSRWPTAESVWIAPALGESKASRARASARKRSKPTPPPPAEDNDESQAQTPTVPVIPNLSTVSKPNIKGQHVPSRVRVLGH